MSTGFAVAKIVRAARHYQQRNDPLRRIADRAIPGVKRDLLASLKGLRELIPSDVADKYARHADWTGLKDAVDWHHFRESLKGVFGQIGKAREAGAQHGATQINTAFAQRRRAVRYRKGELALTWYWDYATDPPLLKCIDDPSKLFSKVIERTEEFKKDANDQYAFDLYSQEVQDELRAAQDALIVGLEQDVRDSIDAIIMDAAQQGLGPEEIVDSIRDLIGLTDRQVAAVGNYRSMLENLDPGALDRQLRNVLEDDVVQQAIDDQTDLAAAYIDKMTDDYVDNYLDYRAETIAQSEVTRAVNAGLQDSYSQAIDRGVFPSEAVRQFWRINPDACEICQSIPDMNPDGVAMDEAFDSIDGPQDAPPDPHPHCFCSLEIVTDLDMVSADSVDDGEAA